MSLETRVSTSMTDIPRQDWERLTQKVDTPILEWEWLELLESSGSIDTEHGWTPQHITIWRGSDLVAGAPLYLKTHSWGEFVYDFMFAQAAPRVRASWYPKLVGMSPVTPSVGWRILTAPGEDAGELEALWIESAEDLARKLGATSLQMNFTDPDWSDGLGPRTPHGGSWLRWSHQNFLWHNESFEDFDGYLAAFDKNQRRNIKRERARFTEQGLNFRMIPGEEIPREWFPLMAHLYEKTNDQFGPYAARFLEPAFFELLDKIRPLLLFGASFEKGAEVPLALSFLLRKGKTLIGRYWGERAHRDNQYFNMCYYGPIEWAISNGVQAFDPGAGSNLKVRRGFRSEKNTSLHRFFHPGAEKLFSTFIDEINQQEEENIRELNEAIPFKKNRGFSNMPLDTP